MRPWIAELADWRAAGVPAVLVTVAATRGSTPRAPGVHMLVSDTRCHGTIGGGQLELRVIGLARQLITDAATSARLVRFPLAASVGQCCGGVVDVVLEPVNDASDAWMTVACRRAAAGQAWGRVVRLSDHNEGTTAIAAAAAATTRVFASAPDAMPGDLPASAFSGLAGAPELARQLLAGAADDARLLARTPGGRAEALLEVSVPPELQVLLFGAGHVGRAIAEVLGRLPMRVRWIDTRDDAFPADVADNIARCSTDSPEVEVRAAPANAAFLVLTHSHALDFELVRAILERADFRFCGMIGSATKRASFARRLRARGCHEDALARLQCPLGMPAIMGKEPEVIAVAVAAALLPLRQQGAATHRR